MEKALEVNTLAVLPTAPGKTVLAELLHRDTRCRIQPTAPTKPPVLRHMESVLKHPQLSEDEVADVTGEKAGCLGRPAGSGEERRLDKGADTDIACCFTVWMRRRGKSLATGSLRVGPCGVKNGTVSRDFIPPSDEMV